MIGATVYGIQLANIVLDDTLFEVIRELWLQHLVLFFRNQEMSSQEHLAIAERFGSLHTVSYTHLRAHET